MRCMTGEQLAWIEQTEKKRMEEQIESRISNTMELMVPMRKLKPDKHA